MPLLAVPMFILAAALFGASGITEHLFALIRLAVGRIRGGLGHVTVLANLVFSGISGAALADIGALGGTQIREFDRAASSDCDAGWQYSSDRSSIVLCRSTCDELSRLADENPDVAVRVRFGCNLTPT